MSAERTPQKIPRLSAEETERIRRTPGRSAHPICGIVIGSSWHEPVACAYPPGHTGDHSWASIPQFNPAKRLEEQLRAYEKALRLIQATPRLIDTHHIARSALSTPAKRPT